MNLDKWDLGRRLVVALSSEAPVVSAAAEKNISDNHNLSGTHLPRNYVSADLAVLRYIALQTDTPFLCGKTLPIESLALHGLRLVGRVAVRSCHLSEKRNVNRLTGGRRYKLQVGGSCSTELFRASYVHRSRK